MNLSIDEIDRIIEMAWLGKTKPFLKLLRFNLV